MRFLLAELLKIKVEGKRLDFLVVVILNILGVLYTIWARDTFWGKFLIAGLVSQTPVIAFLSIRRKKPWKKILFATFIFDALFESFDFIAEFTRAWVVTSLAIPYKLFGVLPYDNILGHMSIVLYTVVVYEHFFNNDDAPETVSKRSMSALRVGIIGLIVAFLVFFYNASLLNMPYPFLILGSLAVIPTILVPYIRPHMLPRIATSGIYFFFYYLAIELLANAYKFWIYTGSNYIGFVSFFGLTFPFEEFFFWCMLYGPTIIVYYELWIDDLS